MPEVQSFVADTTGFNERERMEARQTRPECWTCHQQFDPLAIGFSRFDGAGHYLGDADDQGKSLGLDGWVPTTAENDAPHYGDVAEYMQILSTEPMVQTCMTEHFIAFATAADEQRSFVEKLGRVEWANPDQPPPPDARASASTPPCAPAGRHCAAAARPTPSAR